MKKARKDFVCYWEHFNYETKTAWKYLWKKHANCTGEFFEEFLITENKPTARVLSLNLVLHIIWMSLAPNFILVLFFNKYNWLLTLNQHSTFNILCLQAYLAD